MKQQSYIIAGHHMLVKGDELVSVLEGLEGFQPFLVTGDRKESPALIIVSADDENVKEPDFKDELYVFDSEERENIKSTFGTTNDGYMFQMIPDRSEGMTLWCEKGKNIFYMKGNLSGSPMCYRVVRFAVWIAYGIATTHLDTIAIHTSTITYKGRNVLFLGESGTGKSTHTRLWRENIEGATLLNDDSPIVRAIDGEIYVYGSPWSGKTPCYKNERYPLAGCVRLSQAPYNKIRRLNVLQAYAAIHPSCPPDFAYDEYLYDGISATLDKLLSKVPFYHLECLPNAEAAQLSMQTIFNE